MVMAGSSASRLGALSAAAVLQVRCALCPFAGRRGALRAARESANDRARAQRIGVASSRTFRVAMKEIPSTPALRAVHVVPHVQAEASGPSYTVPALCEALAREAHDVTLLSMTPFGESEPRVVPAPVRHLTVPEGRFSLAGYSAELRRRLRSCSASADIIHNHGMWSFVNWDVGAATAALDVPMVFAPRGCLSPVALRRSRLRKRVCWWFAQRRAVERARCLHATSNKEVDEIRASGLRQPIALIENGVDIPSLPQRSASSGRRRALFLGRLHPIKGIDVLLDAWSQLSAAASSEWELWITGPGPQRLRADLQARAQALGLRDSVRWSEGVYGDAKVQAYADADLYLLPWKTENFGMTVAESMAAATPVLTTTGTPWRDLDERRCGFSVAPTVSGLRDGLEQALQTPADELREMGARGRDWMAREFSWQQIASRTAALYEWLTGRTSEVPSCLC